MNNRKNGIMIAVIAVLVTVMVSLVGVCVLIYLDMASDGAKKGNVNGEETAVVETEAPVSEGGQITTMYVANVENSVYLRGLPEENDDNIITTIPLGAQVVWISDETAVFSKVSYGGNTGYVKRDYLSTTPPDLSGKQTTNNTTVWKYMYVANVKNSIYLRSSAKEVQSNIITTIPLGTEVGFIEYANGEFSKINYNGTIGYAKTKYLADYNTPGYDYMTVYNVKHSIYLRSAPYENPDNILCEIPLGSVVQFIGDAGGGFYKISWGGYTGYSKSKFLR